MSFSYFLSENCNILFKNLLLNLPFLIFCKKKFFKNLVFLTDTVADLAVCCTLSGRYTLCAHCTFFNDAILPSMHYSPRLGRRVALSRQTEP
jgi:hypothetical protein